MEPRMYEAPGSIAWMAFEDALINSGFQLKLSNSIYDISENGIVIFSVDKTTVKYSKRLYSSHDWITAKRISELEEIIYTHCGWGGEGSTRLLEPEEKRKERVLHSSHYPDLFTVE